MLPSKTTTQQFNIHPALTWRQYFLYHIFCIIKSSNCLSANINPCYPCDWWNGINRLSLFPSFLLFYWLELWASRRMLTVAVKDSLLEREGTNFAENVIINPPQVQCPGLHKHESWSGAEVCLRQAGRFRPIPSLPHWTPCSCCWWDHPRHKHNH